MPPCVECHLAGTSHRVLEVIARLLEAGMVAPGRSALHPSSPSSFTTQPGKPPAPASLDVSHLRLPPLIWGELAINSRCRSSGVYA